jgi:hypothetical protein
MVKLEAGQVWVATWTKITIDSIRFRRVFYREYHEGQGIRISGDATQRQFQDWVSRTGAKLQVANGT